MSGYVKTEEEKERIYQSVLDIDRDNSVGVLQVKINKLHSIIDYKNAEELIKQCYKKLEKAQKREERKRIRRVLFFVLDILLVTFVVVLCIFLIRRHS